MKVVRQNAPSQVGRFSVIEETSEFTIEGSLQPTGRVSRSLLPEGVNVEDSVSIYVMGKTALNLGDIVVTKEGVRYKVVVIEADWRDLGNYAKYAAEKVRE